MLTWFAHDVDSLETRARIFDMLITSPDRDMILYLCAAVRASPPSVTLQSEHSRLRAPFQLLVLHRDDILAQPPESDVMHSYLNKLARQPWDADAAARLAQAAYESVPRASLVIDDEATAELMAVARTKKSTWGARRGARLLQGAALTLIASVAAAVLVGVASNVSAL